ncbi:MAG: cyclase family protein [Alphaproteobacteria bacterium]|nr:MAG: cyclase family protein [Alphaproteobacteria bacterium]
MLNGYRVICLTHKLNSGIPSWDMSCDFHSHKIQDYDACETETKFCVQKINMPAGIGTHIDAPAHCMKEGLTVDQLSLDDLMTQCVMIDVSSQAHENFKATIQDVESFETQYGIIPKNSFVIFYTGWSKHWSVPQKYRNNLTFPSVSAEVAYFLVKRGVAGIGIDTLSPDRPKDGFKVHEIILGAGKYIIENIANADQLPPINAYSIALPIHFEGGTEAPIRLIAFIPKK